VHCGTSIPILVLLRFFVFQLQAHTGQTDGGQTDGQTCNAAYTMAA